MPIEFKHDAHKAIYEKVGGFVRELFGEAADAFPDAPIFRMRNGSAVAHISVNAWGEDDATVGVTSLVVKGAEMTADLMKYLLTENANMRFGAFSVDRDGDILFDHATVGSQCTKLAIKHSVLAVLFTADRYDDEIVSRFGGQRLTD